MAKAAKKIQRIMDALEHREPDRLPISDFFWSNFVYRCQRELDAGVGFNPYRHWDLDYVVIGPNMDPHITGIRILENNAESKLVKTGFETIIERRRDLPLPRYIRHDTAEWAGMEAFRFDDPLDPRRYRQAVDDQINCVGDELHLGIRPFADRVAAYAGDFCVFGAVCEPQEFLWRLCGLENSLMKMAEDPARMARFIRRIGDFLLGIVEGQLDAAGDMLAGLFIWGDVAYRNAMFFSPDYWREAYMPEVARLVAAIKRRGKKVIYHGCGDASPILGDLIDLGIDGYNPVEAKAGLDAVRLKRQYGDRCCWIGNIDVRVLEKNDPAELRRELGYKLKAADGGGFMPQSDHSVSSLVSAATYQAMVDMVRGHKSAGTASTARQRRMNDEALRIGHTG